jgi:hypothetical protein
MRESRNVAVAMANHKDIMIALRKCDLRAPRRRCGTICERDASQSLRG